MQQCPQPLGGVYMSDGSVRRVRMLPFSNAGGERGGRTQRSRRRLCHPIDAVYPLRVMCAPADRLLKRDAGAPCKGNGKAGISLAISAAVMVQ